MTSLPSSAYPACLACSGPVVPSVRVLHEVVGYTRSRSQGGTNHLIARRETGRLICDRCAPSIQRGDDPRQGGACDA